VLVGRSSELKELGNIVDQARSGASATLVIRGEPGVGKSVLLHELESIAHDFRVIRTEGTESELTLDYRLAWSPLSGVPPGPSQC
jgi:predicted ATP-dependent serine protease